MRLVKRVFAEEAKLELVMQKGESSDKEAEVRGWLPAAGLTFLICPYLCVCVCLLTPIQKFKFNGMIKLM